MDEQFDIQLQGCHNDCTEYFQKGSWEVRTIQGQGINATDPTRSHIDKGVAFAKTFGISYCFISRTAKTSIYL